jgi:hypothetical protein
MNDVQKIKNVLITEKNIQNLQPKEVGEYDYNIKKLLNNNRLDQSQSIRFGNMFENFIKDLADSLGAILLDKKFLDIYYTNSKTNKGKKDVDICFTYNDIIYYFECKTNLNLDSEKSKATDKKVGDIIEFLEKENNKTVIGGVVSCWYEFEEKLPNSLKSKLFFFKDIINIFNLNLSKNEYYDILKEFGNKI